MDTSSDMKAMFQAYRDMSHDVAALVEMMNTVCEGTRVNVFVARQRISAVRESMAEMERWMRKLVADS